ncbi:LptF/LptG family permease [Pseudogemmatithrix spongiicola]|uniref:LptF/LptG family permease n=1 Tax=Pseudogemmatithrix spongiicola TaxID=3062599 RepID=A0AA49JW45_9BACT|nr:LptF/LptG family permease [Gemmatimonadaceae bacterium 'strain 138']WKW15977.1 LptF/LptG family permease [Gemmatimonadaceae bacterium 'strain 318']
MKIVHRYVLKEHLGPLLFAVSALTSLMMLNFIAKKFPDLVGKGLPWTVIGEFLMLSLPFTLAMTLPMAVLVATLHAFSRFASENEITAFKASGVSMQVLVRPVILSAVVLALGMVWFNDQVMPRANHRLAQLQQDIARVKPTLALNEQVINEVVRGSLYLRAARIESGSNRMHDVTIYDLSDPTTRRSILADSGQLAFSRSGTDLILTLYDGHSMESQANSPQRLQRSFFEEDRIAVRGIAAGLDRGSSNIGYKSDREYTICELNDRVRAAREPRDIAWRRLHLARNPGDSLATPPRERWPLADWYCALQTRLSGIGEVKEAQAATLAGPAAAASLGILRAVQDPPSRNDAPPPDYDSVVLEGLRFEYSSAQSQIDRYRVEIEKKFSIAASCVVFALLGAPIALRFPRGGVGLTIGVSLGVFAIYYVGLLVGESLSDRGLVDPAIAMWAANALLGVVGITLTARLGSEGSTHRGSESSEWWGRLVEGVKTKFARKAA